MQQYFICANDLKISRGKRVFVRMITMVTLLALMSTVPPETFQFVTIASNDNLDALVL